MLTLITRILKEDSSTCRIQRPFHLIELMNHVISTLGFLCIDRFTNQPVKKRISRGFLCLAFFTLAHASFSQVNDSTKRSVNFAGSVSVTNNGFSFIPSFSLGKPAIIVDLLVGGKRFSFDPQFRFDLEGLKPWSFIFIWRYKLIQSDRWQVKPGVHLPAIAFRSRIVDTNGTTYEQVYAQRFITPELTVSYSLNRNISVGTYYIYGLGLEKAGQTKHTHFLSLRSSLNNLQLTKDLWMRWDPQVYYLKLDVKDGFYVAHTLSMGVKDFPLLVATTMNKALETDVASKDFDWNISLVYTFGNQWVKK